MVSSEVFAERALKAIREGIVDALEYEDSLSGRPSRPTPKPVEYLFGDRETSSIGNFPAVLVETQSSYSADTQSGFDQFAHRIVIIVWVVEPDPEWLLRFLMRYGNAVRMLLRAEASWGDYAHSSKVSDIQYSDIYRTPAGLAKGCRISAEVREVR